jgi:hypothetical protein
VEGGEEGCGAACVANAECTAFSYSKRSTACRLYSATTKTRSKAGSTWFVRDDHCAAANAAATTTATAAVPPEQCLALTPFKARPRCGASARKGNFECCPGTECMGKRNHKGKKVYRCDIRVPRKSQQDGEVCTGTKHCGRGSRCDRNRYVCYDKKSGKPDPAPASRRRSTRSGADGRASSAARGRTGGGVAPATVVGGGILVLFGVVCAAVGLVRSRRSTLHGRNVAVGPESTQRLAAESSVDASVVGIEVIEDEPALFAFKSVNRELVY